MDKGFLPQALDGLDIERLKKYRKRLDFYHGRQHSPNRPAKEKALTFNYSKVVIDKLTSYLMTGVHANVEPIDSLRSTKERALRAEKALAQVYRHNNLQQLDYETEIDCAILGDGCYKVTWDDEQQAVRVTTPDVQGIYVWWRGDDTSRIWKIASRYELNAEEAQEAHDCTPNGKTAQITEVWTENLFELWVDNELVESKENPYGFIPFIVYPNLREPKSFWGVSDIEQLVEPQRELNRAMSQLSKILELSGNPIAVLENIEQSEDIAVRPGAVWNLPEDAKAYLLDLLQGGGVNLHINYIDLLYRTLHDMAEAPRAAFGTASANLSGVAMEIELQPLLQKVWRKRLIRTTLYNKRNQMILKLLEKYRGEDYSGCIVQTIWSPILPRDMASTVNNEQIMVQNGLHSRRRAMTELGVKNPEQEFERWLEERGRILKMNKGFGETAAKGRESEKKLARQLSAKSKTLNEREAK